MLLSELKAIVDKETEVAKAAEVDPEVRILILPNFPTSLSLRKESVSSLDLSLSKGARQQGNFIYLAEDKDEGPVWGEFVERFGWDERTAWRPPDKPKAEPEVEVEGLPESVMEEVEAAIIEEGLS